jgi:1-acyl-sn-glycerol-3-phosphate acyltransferase
MTDDRASMLDLDYLARYRVLPDPLWEGAVAGGFGRCEDLTRTRLALHDFAPPESPVLYATNSTQKYDFMTFRSAMRRRGQRIVTVTKAKSYHDRLMEPVLARTGVIPLASRGYVILADTTRTAGRRPTEEEYRACRDHLDRGAELPSTAFFDGLRTRPRSILGVPFDPATRGLREAWRAVYRALLGEALRFAREAVAAGFSIHIYPEGTVASRLGKGRVGVIQLAQALGVRVVPVGMSGCRQVFLGASAALRGGTVDLRFGAAYLPDLAALPGGFRAFDPDDEDRHRATLQGATDALMTRIDALLAPAYQHRDDHLHDGTLGTRRFL